MPPRTALRIADGFAPLVVPFDVTVLDELPATVCAVSSDLRIAYVNPAWVTFGLANGAKSAEASCYLGSEVQLAVPDVLRPFYDSMYARALEQMEPVEHDYECSSPTQYRLFRMRIHPCRSGACVIVHSLRRETAHTAHASPPLEQLYRDERGFIVQCANCRRVHRPRTGDGTTAEWDWVPDYVAFMPPRTSHGICALCDAFYYS